MIVPQPKAVLFDFDGVVANSTALHHRAWSHVFRQLFGRPLGPFPAEAVSGKAPRLIAAYLAEQGGNPDLAEQLHDEKLHYLLASEPPPLLPGVRALMEALWKRDIPYGIASNAPGPFVRWAARRASLHVAVILGVEDVAAAKPEPTPYLELADQLGVDQSDYPATWVLEDSRTGMQAAVATDMYPIGITTHYDAATLRAEGARATYATPAALLAAWQAIA